MYYKIVWLKSHNLLGETGERIEQRIENVILWIVKNRESLQRISGGFSVYKFTGEEKELPETVFNWQTDKEKCFGHLKKQGFYPHVFIRNGRIIFSRK